MNSTSQTTKRLGDSRLLDVTLRDGSLAIGFDWSFDEARAIVQAVVEAGIPYIEIGYVGGVPEAHGVSAAGVTCSVTTDFIQYLKAYSGDARLVAMLHPTMPTSAEQIVGLRDEGLHGLRLVFHPSWAEALERWLDCAKCLGLWVSVNIALASQYSIRELVTWCSRFRTLGADAVYIADTCSGLLPSDVGVAVSALSQLAPAIGIHAHNHLGLAIANSLSAVAAGASFVDVSIGGLGRGPGNAPAELWTAILARDDRSWASVRAILSVKTLVSKKCCSLQAVDWTRTMSGVFNLSPPQEDILRAEVGSSSQDEYFVFDRCMAVLGSMGVIPKLIPA